jgi:hypothetical protein
MQEGCAAHALGYNDALHQLAKYMGGRIVGSGFNEKLVNNALLATELAARTVSAHYQVRYFSDITNIFQLRLAVVRGSGSRGSGSFIAASNLFGGLKMI